MSRDIHPGLQIRDYVFEERIGVGGMGEVWRARHTVLQRTVAIKVMVRHLETDPEFGQRFLQEARAQAQLSHPRIVGVSDFFSEEGQYFLVMPLMSGKTLADRLDEARGPLPLSEALTVARDVLDALDYAHQKAVIHRDVKPSNILLDADGHACLTDFGIALSLGKNRLTRTGTSLGTPHYMSPEQIRTPRTLDHRTDVYSFGCVFYEMLAGRPPFSEASDSDDTDFALKEAHVYRTPESIRKWNPEVPGWLDALVLRALAKKPDERFSGCGEMRRALDAPPPPQPSPLLVQPVSPPPLPPPAAIRGAARTRRGLSTTLIATGITLLLALCVLAVYFAIRDGQSVVEGDEPPVETTTEPMGTDLTSEPMGTDMETVEPMGTDMGIGEPMGTDMGGEEPVEPPPQGREVEKSREQGPEHVDSFRGALAAGQGEEHEVWLEQGYTYTIGGICDEDCEDLDLYLYADGSAVDADNQDDDVPVIIYTPVESRRFVLRVGMPKCSVAPCTYSVNVFRTSEGP